MDTIYLAAMDMVQGLSRTKMRELVRFFGSARAAWQAGRSDLLSSKCLDQGICNNLLVQREMLDVNDIAETLQKKQIKLCGLFDAEYPVLLRGVHNAPLLLYYRGNLPPDDRLIAMVGARKATAYGKNAAQMLAREIASSGFWIVSGAARGIDSASHRGALTSGCTVAVLGCGVDVVYPPENGRLLAEIAGNGAVISEYPPGTRPIPGYFPARNRIISGMSRGVAIVEAAERSGALITADFALEEGRDVFAVPGSIFSATSKGTHHLIRQGAKLAESAQDILEEYGVQPEPQQDRNARALTGAEKIVFFVLTADIPATMEEIVLKTKLPLAEVTYILLQLELRGLIVGSGQRYLRVVKEEPVDE